MSMRIHLVTGGARSGKSLYAEQQARLLSAAHGTNCVTYIATAQTSDEEMCARIARHRARRPPAWITIEAARHAADAVLRASTPIVLVDCLTLLASNAFLQAVTDFDAASALVDAEVNTLLEAAVHRHGELIVVTNEVGFGIVPEYEQGRWFRDLLGRSNCAVAAAAALVTLIVAGCPVRLKG
jgi:adenosylcobinamide kinase / adenosylcobinamide-phosphate guanylyltransferase